MRNGTRRLVRALMSASVLSLVATAGWSQSLTWLGTLPGGDITYAHAVTDGAVVVGWAYNASRQWRAFRWTASEGMQNLGTLGGNESWAWGVSANGAVVVGEAHNDAGQRRAFRWENGVMQDLGTLPSGTWSGARGVSADGDVVVGVAPNAAGQWSAFRWENGVMQDLGTLPGGYYSGAYGVSADGAVVVGVAQNAAAQSRAFRWTASSGRMEDLNTTYASLLTNGSVLRSASAISPDGRYIVGQGYNAATGRTEAFLLDTIPEPASLIALGAGLAGLVGLRRRKQA